MIFDAILAVFGSLLGSLAFVVLAPVNALIAVIEWTVGLFTDGISIGRIGGKRQQSPALRKWNIAIGLILLVAVAAGLLAPVIMQRTVTLVAEDGHSLPYAAVIIQRNANKEHKRTDDSGNIRIPRFGDISLTVKDPRYVAKTWHRSEMERELVVQRSAIGSGIDRIADKLINKFGGS